MYTLAVAADGTMTLAQDGTSGISAVTVKQNVSAPYTYIYEYARSGGVAVEDTGLLS